jgi:hypothetical protein
MRCDPAKGIRCVDPNLWARIVHRIDQLDDCTGQVRRVQAKQNGGRSDSYGFVTVVKRRLQVGYGGRT